MSKPDAWVSYIRDNLPETHLDRNNPPPPFRCEICPKDGSTNCDGIPPLWSEVVGGFIPRSNTSCGTWSELQSVKNTTVKAYDNFIKRLDKARIPMGYRKWSVRPRTPKRNQLHIDQFSQAIAAICNSWNGSDWIIAAGPVGTGKTSWLTALLVDHLAASENNEALWVSEQGFFREAALRAEQKFSGREQVLQRLIDTPLLLIDDIGSRHRELTEWQGGAMRDLFMERHLADKPTLITTNMNWDEIQSRYGNHIRSRLAEVSHWVHLSGPDYRRK